MARLAGKVAFITGAGTGIGRATAVQFALEGVQVVVDIAAAAGEDTARRRSANAPCLVEFLSARALRLLDTPMALLC